MIGVEIISEHAKGNNANGNLDGAMAKAIKAECFLRGLLLETGGRHGAVLRFLPPLVITDEEIDQLAERLGDAIYAISNVQKIA